MVTGKAGPSPGIAGAPARPPSSSETGVIHLQDVRVSYGPVAVLDDLSLQVRSGEFMSILGRSGVGKTTLLRVMAGFERISSGYMRIGGRLVASSFVHVPPDRRRIGIVFQDYALFPHLTVLDNVAFGLREMDRREKEAKVGPVLEMAGLGGYERRYPHELSGGQQQRVALARALAPDPVALLMDEPFSNLDRQMRAALRREVRAIVKKAGATAILVTHDREEAMALADRVAIMAQGRVAQVGKPRDVYEHPSSPDVARLIAPSELLPGILDGDYVRTEAGAFLAESGGLKDGVSVLALMRATELDIELSQDGKARNGVAAPGGADLRVVYGEYRGEFSEYGVRLPSGTVLRVRRRSGGSFAEGDAVSVRLRPGMKLVVFPAASVPADSDKQPELDPVHVDE